MKKKILNILVLLTIFALMISPVMAIDEPGLHFGEDSENIEFENVGFFDSFFSIFTDEGTYEPGDTSTFIVQSTSSPSCGNPVFLSSILFQYLKNPGFNL